MSSVNSSVGCPTQHFFHSYYPSLLQMFLAPFSLMADLPICPLSSGLSQCMASSSCWLLEELLREGTVSVCSLMISSKCLAHSRRSNILSQVLSLKKTTPFMNGYIYLQFIHSYNRNLLSTVLPVLV